MKLTIVNQFYPPDASPTAKLAESLAEHRAAQGDVVTIIAGEGYLADGDAERPRLRVVRPPDPTAEEPSGEVRVLRVKTPTFGKTSLWRRVAAGLLFFLSAAWKIFWTERQDAIICLTSPPLVIVIGWFKKLFNPRARLILWNMDCYPEVVERSRHLSSRGMMVRLIAGANYFFARSIDTIVCLCDSMETLVQARPGRKPPTVVIPTWQPLDQFPPARLGATEDDERQAPNLTVLYAGNMGVGHEFETILQAARRLSEEPIRFVFSGGGVRRAEIETWIAEHQLTNVAVQDYVPSADLPRLLASADCALITLRESMLGVMSPSKLQTSLAMGMPVLYIGPAGSNVDEALVRFDCGVGFRNGDVDGVVAGLRLLARDPQRRAELQRRARSAFETAYCDAAVLPRFDALLDDGSLSVRRAA